MNEMIGSTAGVVWQFLDQNGPTSVTKLVKDTGIDAKLAQRAIGWLAKEDKLTIETNGRIETISLK